MQKVTKYCDPCYVLKNGTETRVEVTKEYNVGDGPKEIEICEPCEDSLSLKDLKRVLDDAGRAVVQKRPKEQGGGVPRKQGQGASVKYGEYHCRFCDKSMTTMQGRGMHEFRDHPWQRLMWEKETDFQVSKTDDKNRRAKWFKQLDRLGISLEEAARREKAMGPPGSVWSPDVESIANRIRVVENASA